MNTAHHKVDTIAVVHVGMMAVFATWAFGGNVDWARSWLSVTGNAGLIILAFAVRARIRSGASLRALHLLWPLLALNVLVGVSLVQPNLRAITIEGGEVFVARSGIVGPASARRELTWDELMLFNALFIPAFNLLIVVRSARLLHGLVFALAGNAVALAIFGSLQALSGAKGLYFGAIHSPNARFFSTFVYRNHWGAFAILMLGACLALLFRKARPSHARDFWHSTTPAATLAVLLLAASIPLSGSRACTALALVLLGVGFIHALRRIGNTPRNKERGTGPAVTTLLIISLLSLGGITYLSRDILQQRVADTHQQLADIRSTATVSRVQLYRDTVRMAADRLAFGWGLGTYGAVFPLYNSQSSPKDGLPVHYEHAHSDWLEWLAETGVVGLLSLLALVLGPIAVARAGGAPCAFSSYLLAACGLVLAYATIEFPLANPAVLLSFWILLFVSVRWVRLIQPV